MSNLLRESETRYSIIDPLIAKAGRNPAGRGSIACEVPVDSYDASSINDITDYCLFRDNGKDFQLKGK